MYNGRAGGNGQHHQQHANAGLALQGGMITMGLVQLISQAMLPRPATTAMAAWVVLAGLSRRVALLGTCSSCAAASSGRASHASGGGGGQ